MSASEVFEVQVVVVSESRGTLALHRRSEVRRRDAADEEEPNLLLATPTDLPVVLCACLLALQAERLAAVAEAEAVAPLRLRFTVTGLLAYIGNT